MTQKGKESRIKTLENRIEATNNKLKKLKNELKQLKKVKVMSKFSSDPYTYWKEYHKKHGHKYKPDSETMKKRNERYKSQYIEKHGIYAWQKKEYESKKNRKFKTYEEKLEYSKTVNTK